MALTTVPAGLLGANAALTNITPGSITPAYLSTQSQYTGFKNRIINGAMRIDQRNAGASVTPADGAYVLDRWNYGASQASKVSIQQNAGSVTPPAGFSNYLGATSLSAYSVTAGDLFRITQLIEGFNFADMAWGTANAKTITLSFQVYSSLTGTFGGALVNSANNRSYPFTYTVSSANTWTPVAITVAGDTSGTWVGATNGIGCRVHFSLGAGASYSGTAGAWASTLFTSATGATSVVGTNGATFYITGVQLEVGSTATSFDVRDYGRELIMCQRYYEKSYDIGTIAATVTYSSVSIGAASNVGTGIYASFKTPKRSAPTIILYSPVTGATDRMASNSTDFVCSATGSGVPIGTNGFVPFASGITSGIGYQHWTASAEL